MTRLDLLATIFVELAIATGIVVVIVAVARTF
jgi:hypothetical protein